MTSETDENWTWIQESDGHWTTIDEAISRVLSKAMDTMAMLGMLNVAHVQLETPPLTWEGLMAQVDAAFARGTPATGGAVPSYAVHSLAPLKLIESEHMVERVLHARSPARAKRRMRRGYPQHYITRPMRAAYLLDSDHLVMHREMAARLKAALRNSD